VAWRSALTIVKPETVIAWHRAGFRLFWTWKVRCGKPGRPVISPEVRALIRKMCRENPSWGAPRSPWQRAYVERVIGSVRREWLDHVIVFHESSLRRILTSYFDYYHRSRTHLSLRKDSPEPRAIQPPEMGSVVAVPQVGGLHYRYERRAA
jgi:transposase InsO family protein